MSDSRARILSRLRERKVDTTKLPQADFSVLEQRQWSDEDRVALFQRMLESVQGEVLRVPHADWVAALRDWLQQERVKNLLVGASGELTQILSAAWDDAEPRLLPYDGTAEDWQDQLFHRVDAALTSVRAGIAETGSLVIWPTADEPRSMSLIPPIHIAVLDADQIHDNFLQVMRTQQWSKGMPTNALLVSGPSKTADIEQTLAFGVHGPKKLLVLVRE